MNQHPRIFMMDLWATVPYYTAYLSRALLAEGVPVMVGSISYYLDLDCFSSRGLKLQPGLLDIVGRLQLPRTPRRILKMAEALVNMAALTLRFLVSPPDVIHVQYLPMLLWRLPLEFWFLAFCRARGSKIVLTVHDLLPHDTAESHKQTFLRLYRSVDAIICHSQHVKTRLEAEFHVLPAIISIIPHGPFFYDLPIDLPTKTTASTPPEMQVDPGHLLVLWQGILFPYKGLDILLDAWQRVESEIPNAWLVVVGTGAPDLLDQLQQQIHRLGLTHVKLNLRFVSAEELVAVYRAADIVVYPYRSITTSGALATGLALGKTIVASDLPVFRELLTDHENALLVPPLDPGRLAQAIVTLSRDPGLRAQFAQRVAAMNFGDQSWLSIAAETLEVYKPTPRGAVTS
jgi:glycosyltransferase involved in cell wall biosynthesis